MQIQDVRSNVVSAAAVPYSSFYFSVPFPCKTLKDPFRALVSLHFPCSSPFDSALFGKYTCISPSPILLYPLYITTQYYNLRWASLSIGKRTYITV